MRKNSLPLIASAAIIVCFALFQVAHATAITVDAISGASGGRSMVTISAIDVTTNTASITYSEGYNNGSFRFYYSTTAFANASDTTRATVTKMSVTTRRSGTLKLSGLAVGTKYYYRFQGYYTKGTANYWATGTLATLANTAVLPRGNASSVTVSASHDILGRPRGNAAGIAVDEVQPKIRISE